MIFPYPKGPGSITKMVKKNTGYLNSGQDSIAPPREVWEQSFIVPVPDMVTLGCVAILYLVFELVQGWDEVTTDRPGMLY